MAASSDDVSADGALGWSKSVSTIGAVMAASLATWLFFYRASMPLGLAETTVVVGAWLAVALLVKWAWRRRRPRQPSPGDQS